MHNEHVSQLFCFFLAPATHGIWLEIEKTRTVMHMHARPRGLPAIERARAPAPDTRVREPRDEDGRRLRDPRLVQRAGRRAVHVSGKDDVRARVPVLVALHDEQVGGVVRGARRERVERGDVEVGPGLGGVVCAAGGVGDERCAGLGCEGR